MERYTVMASFNGSSLPQKPTVHNNETSYTSLPPKPYLGDASFSSYFRPDAPKSVPNGTEISIFDAERYFNENPDQKQNTKPPPVNVNLERIVDLSTVSRLSSVSSVDGYGRNYRTGSFHATPTASSEASWNSQSGLLSNPPGSIAVSIKNLHLNEKGKGSSRKWLFGRKCPCSGKKSVDVEEKLSESKNSNSNGSLNSKKQSSKAGEAAVEKLPPKEKAMEIEKSLETEKLANLKLVGGSWVKDQNVARRDSGRFKPDNHFPAELGRRIVPSGRSLSDALFSFPILNPPSATGKPLSSDSNPPEDLPRDSLEVFQPSDEMGVRKLADFQRRTMMSFSSDNGRRSFAFPTSPKTRAVADDDMASDSSSDLFEIESFSTQTTLYPTYRRRDSLDEITSGYEARRFIGGGAAGLFQFRRSLDETSSVAPTECYEPSEVSVEWSVTTAEGFDRGSVANFSTSASEYEELRFVRLEPEKVTVSGGGRRKGNGLLSCRCEKAVSVGPHSVRNGSEQQKVAPTPFLPVVGSAHVPVDPNKSSLARSHSARLSRPFTTR